MIIENFVQSTFVCVNDKFLTFNFKQFFLNLNYTLITTIFVLLNQSIEWVIEINTRNTREIFEFICIIIIINFNNRQRKRFDTRLLQTKILLIFDTTTVVYWLTQFQFCMNERIFTIHIHSSLSDHVEINLCE